MKIEYILNKENVVLAALDNKVKVELNMRKSSHKKRNSQNTEDFFFCAEISQIISIELFHIY